MSGGPKRNPDKINTIGVVVVGICGAVLVYVSIVALQAFYTNDIADVQTMADYGGQDSASRALKSSQMQNLSEYVSNPAPAAAKPGEAAKAQTFRILIKDAKRLVVAEAKADPANLVPAVGRSDTATIDSVFGRPQPLPGATPTTPTPTPTPADAGSAAQLGMGSGSAAPGTGTPVDPAAAPTTSTGTAPAGAPPIVR
ncbi:MAG: hypothetical protein H0T79_13170 [Deltaproteobacteria bacterium]|nr:hypothetical protein [Deltaproteobacteria bacterium]